MAIEASSASHPFQTFRTPSASFLAKRSPKLRIRTLNTSLTSSAAITVLLTTPNDVNAFTLPKEEIITSLTKVESAIDHVQEVGAGVLDFSQQSIKVVINLALPILQKSGDQALKIASPVIEEVSKKTQEAIHSSPEPIHIIAKIVGDVAQQAVEVLLGVKPIALSTVEIIARSEPTTIMEASGVVLVTYLLLPTLFSAVSYNLRGYKGKLSPAQTLDLLSKRNYFMIDIRLQYEQNIAGFPLLPSTAKNKIISIPAEVLPRKVKALVRNTRKAEAGITALKISCLKLINRDSNIVIMDSSCDFAKAVARELTKLGFKNCWVMAGGFSGKQGWLQSYLGKKSHSASSVEVLSLPHASSPTVQKLQSENEISD